MPRMPPRDEVRGSLHGGHNTLGLGTEAHLPGGEVVRPVASADDPKRAALKAGREQIGLWPLMLWAFNVQKVRFSCGTVVAAKVSHSSMARAMAAGMSGVALGAEGGGYSAAACHDDALEVYLAVASVIDRAKRERPKPPAMRAGRYSVAQLVAGMRPHVAEPELAATTCVDDGVPDGGAPVGLPGDVPDPRGDPRTRAFRFLIVRTEKAKAPPAWDLDLSQPKACLPVLRKNGKPKCVVRPWGRREAFMCLVRYEGYTDAERESLVAAVRAEYAEWVGWLVQVMHEIEARGDRLNRWRVEGLGVAPEPWAADGDGEGLTLGKKT